MDGDQQWKNRLGERPQGTISDLYTEFKNCFGNEFNTDLSDDENEPLHPFEISSDDYQAFIEDRHPFLKPGDVDSGEEEQTRDGKTRLFLNRSRLQGLLMAYAIEQTPRLFDSRKTTIQVDTQECESHVESIVEALRDYAALGLIQLPPGIEVPSKEIVEQMLDMAWQEATQIYSRPQELFRSGRS